MSTPFNPYAFPSHGSMGEVVQEGMSLRDYFAAKVLHAVCLDSGGSSFAQRAEWAYQQADAMLRARLASPTKEPQ